MFSSLVDFFTKKREIIALVLFIACLVVVVLNSKYLVENPFENEIKWDEPTFVIERNDGVIAVVDSYGTRISVVLNDKLIGLVGSNRIVDDGPNKATSIAFAEDTILVVDHLMSENGTEIVGDTILEYSLDGKRIKELFSSSKESNMRICNVYYCEGQCLISAIDHGEQDEAVIAKICDGTIQELYRFSAGKKDIFTVTYNAGLDITSIVTQNGKLHVYCGESGYEFYPSFWGFSLTEAVFTNSAAVCIDSSSDEILVLYGADEYMSISNKPASHVTVNNNRIAFGDPIHSTVTLTDLNGNIIEESSGAKHSVRFMVNVISVYTCLSLAALYILFHIVRFVSAIITVSRRKNVSAFKRKVSEKVTVSDILTGMAPSLLMCFLVAAFVFSLFYWNAATGSVVDNLIDVGVTAMFISKNNVGDKLKNVNSEMDYDSDSYKDIIDVYDSLCGKYTQMVGFDYGYSIYKYIDNSDDVMVVRDKFSEERLGTIFTREEQEAYLIADVLDVAYTSGVRRTLYDFQNGMQLMCIVVPIMDSEENVIGAAELSQNYSAVKADILIQIVKVLVEILTLMAGFSVALAEMKLTKEFVAIQMEIVQSGDKEHTLAEGGHTLAVLGSIFSTTATIFITLIAKDIMDEAGINGAILLALPFTIQTAGYSITTAFLTAVPIRNAKKEMNVGAFLLIAGALMGVVAIKISGYVLLCVASAALSSGASICFDRAVDISKMEKTTDRYSMLESPHIIGPPIATATGALVRTYFGNTAVLIFLILVAVIFIVIKDIFIGRLVAPAERKIGTKLIKETKAVLRCSLKPKTILWLLFALTPYLLLTVSKSYVMPLMTVEMKSSDIIIALVTIISELFSLYLTGIIDRIQKRYPSNVALASDFAVLAIVFLVFVQLLTLQSYLIGIILIYILYYSMKTNKTKVLDYQLEKSGVDDVRGVMIDDFWYPVIEIISPLLLSVMLATGTRSFGWIFFGICLVSTLVMFAFFKQRETETAV